MIVRIKNYAHLNFLSQRNDVTLVKVHYAINVDLSRPIAVHITIYLRCLAEVLRIRVGLFP